MKNKIIFLSFVLSLVGISFYIFPAYAQNDSTDLLNSLKVNIKSLKSTYVPGEAVLLDVEIRNEASSDIRLHGTDVQSGYVKILISNSQEDFKEYTSAAWGNKNQPGKTLKAGQIVTSQAPILANARPESYREDKVMTGYAFPEAGVYYVKAVLFIPREENPIKIESQPIHITINEPVGEDLEVWNKIKDRNDIAYFIQEGQSIAQSDEAKEKFIQEIERIIENNPNSPLISKMKQSLEKFRVNEEKRKELLENLKQRKN